MDTARPRHSAARAACLTAASAATRHFLSGLSSRDFLALPRAELFRRQGFLPFQPADEAEIQLAPLEIDAEDFDADQIAQAVVVPRAVAGERVSAPVVAVVVVFERGDVDQSFRRQL